MVKTGITRRIDELGRLVIPKEIRNNLKIKNNDQVEITVIDNKIILNKYNYLNKDKNIEVLLVLLRKIINKNILFTSRDEIIDYKLVNKEKLDNKSLNEDIMNIIENRKVIVNYRNRDFLYTICPLIINGDLYGSLIVYSENDVNDKETDIIMFSKLFLENYLE